MPAALSYPFSLDFLEIHRESAWRRDYRRATLLYVTGGRGLHQTDEKEWMLAKGDVLILPPGHPHRETGPQGLSLWLMTIPLEILETLQSEMEDGLPAFRALFLEKHSVLLHPRAEDWTGLTYSLQAARQELLSARPGCRACLLGLLRCLLVSLVRAETGKAEGGGLSAALSWIEEHYTEDLSLNQLAALAGTSVRHFDRLFQEAFRMTPKKYIARLRIAQARVLLSRTLRPITEIAFDCGYADSNYFARVFRKICGQSPQQYRQALARGLPDPSGPE